MANYRRVNIDGDSLFKTETRKTAANLLPGTFATINASDLFAQATAVTGRMYVIDSAYHEGLKITDVVPQGHSAIGNYVEEGREMAVLCAPGTYAKDTPVTVNATGQGAVAAGTASVVGYSQDALVIAASTTEFVRIRFRAGTVAAAAATA